MGLRKTCDACTSLSSFYVSIVSPRQAAAGSQHLVPGPASKPCAPVSPVLLLRFCQTRLTPSQPVLPPGLWKRRCLQGCGHSAW